MTAYGMINAVSALTPGFWYRTPNGLNQPRWWAWWPRDSPGSGHSFSTRKPQRWSEGKSATPSAGWAGMTEWKWAALYHPWARTQAPTHGIRSPLTPGSQGLLVSTPGVLREWQAKEAVALHPRLPPTCPAPTVLGKWHSGFREWETKFSLQMQEGHLAPSPDAMIKALNKAS